MEKTLSGSVVMTRTETGEVHAPKFGKLIIGLLHDLSITDGAKILYAHMHWRYGSNRSNYESQKSMAKYLGVTEKTIRNRIDELEAHDWVVTIYQDPDTDGKWQRCQYHIFEAQDDCRRFRLEANLTEGAQMKSKPEGRERKSRKGAGNPSPRPLPHQNSSSDGRQNSGSNGNHQNSGSYGSQNPSSDGRQNSGSKDLDSLNLDSSNKTQESPQAPQGDGVPDGLELMQQAVKVHLKLYGDRQTNVAKLLLNKHTGTKKKHNIGGQPATPDELAKFVADWRRLKPTLNPPAKMEAVNQWFNRWREDGLGAGPPGQGGSQIDRAADEWHRKFQSSPYRQYYANG